MKRIMTLILALGTFAFMVPNVSAETDEYSSERQFVQSVIINVLESEYGIEANTVGFVLHRENLYSMELEKLGSIYAFTANDFDAEGYAIITRKKIDNNWKFYVNEITIDNSSPFFDGGAKNIYLSFGSYYEYKNDLIIDCLSRIEYDYNQVMEYFIKSNVVYASGSGDTSQTIEYFSFDDIEYEETTTQHGFPLLHTARYASNTSFGQTNNCAPIAGTEITLFFDAMYTNLISNVQPLFYNGVEYEYKDIYYYEQLSSLTERNAVDNLEVSSYNDMETNNWISLPFYLTGSIPTSIIIDTGVGTLPSYFYDTLDERFYNKGYYLHTVDIIADENTNFAFFGKSMSDSDYWETYKEQILLDRPVVLQLGLDWSFDYTFTADIVLDPANSSGYYIYTEHNPLSAHVVVGYGFNKYSFYTYIGGSMMLVREDEFMIVANGWGGRSYINIEDNDIGMAYSLFVTIIPGSC